MDCNEFKISQPSIKCLKLKLPNGLVRKMRLIINGSDIETKSDYINSVICKFERTDNDKLSCFALAIEKCKNLDEGRDKWVNFRIAEKSIKILNAHEREFSLPKEQLVLAFLYIYIPFHASLIIGVEYNIKERSNIFRRIADQY